MYANNSYNKLFYAYDAKNEYCDFFEKTTLIELNMNFV